mgnify:FL=1
MNVTLSPEQWEILLYHKIVDEQHFTILYAHTAQMRDRLTLDISAQTLRRIHQALGAARGAEAGIPSIDA